MRWFAMRVLVILIATSSFGAGQVHSATQAVHVYAAGKWSGPVARSYFIPTVTTEEEVIAFREELIRKGARRVNLFLPEKIIVCELPPDGRLDDLHAGRGFTLVRETEVEAAAAVSDDALRVVRGAYDHAERMARLASMPPSVAPLQDPSSQTPQIALTRTPEESKAIDEELGPAAVEDRGVDHNTDILAGNILAQFIFPESRGYGTWTGIETWTSGEVFLARQAAVGALIDLQNRFDKMSMNFIFKVDTDVVISREPASYGGRGDRDVTAWIVETMNALGYGYSTETAQVLTHNFNNYRREYYGADWVFTGFIIDASAVSDRYISQGHTYRNYGWIGGPYFVISFPLGKPIEEFPSEIYFSIGVEAGVARCFWAQIENPGSGDLECGDRWGYLAYTNGNLLDLVQGIPAPCHEYLDDCIMFNFYQGQLDRPFCQWTQGHMGVVDADDNKVPDALDAHPVIEFEIDGPETVDADEITIRFTAVSKAVHNMNQVQASYSRVDYAVPLLSGTMSLGGTQIADIDPLDGTWDEIVEECEVTVADLPEGLTLLQFNVVNSVELESGIVYKPVYRVGMTYARMATTPNDRGVRFQWDTVGEVFGARFDVYRQLRGLPQTAELIATDVPPLGPPKSGILRFEYDDRTIVPGTEYEYYVDAVFSAVVQNQQLDFHDRSLMVSETAMSPLHGASVSQATPNPFKESVTVSVSVPATWQEDRVLAASGVPVTIRQRIATEIRVGVYDVRGRLIKEIFAGSRYGDVFTANWDGRDRTGLPVPSGVYFMKLQTGETTNVRKVMLLR